MVVRLRAAALDRRLVAVLVLRGVAALVAVPDAAVLALVLRVVPVLRVVLALRGAAAVLRLLDDEDELDESSSLHLPDSSRCAASATASAISEPSREALLTIVVAAALALSAASIPASRIARRALGLAAIAAAAAVKPAASISRLIAAFAILSKFAFEVPSFDLPLPLFEDLAITRLPVECALVKDGPAPKRFQRRRIRTK